MSKLRITLIVSFLIAIAGCREATSPSTQEPSIPTLSGTPQEMNSLPPESSIESTPPASNNSTPPTANPFPSSSESPTTAVPKGETSGNNQLISAGGIGPAKVGMTLGQLKQLLAGKATFQVKSPFIVDFDAIAVVQAGK
ncbi:MAG: hypothetical protein LDL41_22900, partial [Coleofasciculus sp. S288]|nr:hypothetical protein [Coleofasciculus sp. S288]